jgi:hypothetical protein
MHAFCGLLVKEGSKRRPSNALLTSICDRCFLKSPNSWWKELNDKSLAQKVFNDSLSRHPPPSGPLTVVADSAKDAGSTTNVSKSKSSRKQPQTKQPKTNVPKTKARKRTKKRDEVPTPPKEVPDSFEKRERQAAARAEVSRKRKLNKEITLSRTKTAADNASLVNPLASILSPTGEEAKSSTDTACCDHNSTFVQLVQSSIHSSNVQCQFCLQEGKSSYLCQAEIGREHRVAYCDDCIGIFRGIGCSTHKVSVHNFPGLSPGGDIDYYKKPKEFLHELNCGMQCKGCRTVEYNKRHPVENKILWYCSFCLDEWHGRGVITVKKDVIKLCTPCYLAATGGSAPNGKRVTRMCR